MHKFRTPALPPGSRHSQEGHFDVHRMLSSGALRLAWAIEITHHRGVPKRETHCVEFGTGRRQRDRIIAKPWRSNWERAVPLLDSHQPIRNRIHTINSADSLHAVLRKAATPHRHFPADEATLKLLDCDEERASPPDPSRPRMEWDHPTSVHLHRRPDAHQPKRYPKATYTDHLPAPSLSHRATTPMRLFGRVPAVAPFPHGGGRCSVRI